MTASHKLGDPTIQPLIMFGLKEIRKRGQAYCTGILGRYIPLLDDWKAANKFANDLVHAGVNRQSAKSN